jgi:ABC-type uncharacterized transport system involved in gliding motility auxiliary subunit
MTASRFSFLLRAGGGILGLAALLAILVAVNLIAGRFVLRADLTEEKLYTLSPGTRHLLETLDRTVTLRFFFNSGNAEIPIPLKAFAQRIEDLLREYETVAAGRIVIDRLDPEPDSDAEEWAQRYGLSAQPLGLMGPRFYLGLAATAADQSR